MGQPWINKVFYLSIYLSISSIIRKHLSILTSSHRCHNILKSAPIVVFRRSNNATLHKATHPQRFFSMWQSLFYVQISIQRTYLSHFPHMFQCKRCHKQHIRETKRRLKERFNEHCWSIDKPTKISKPTTVSEHFLTDHHTANDISLIPLELVHSNRDSVRKAWEAYLITRDNTLQPLGSNKRDEMKHLLFPYMFF